MGKILITGTGRCGSSFLVHLLSALGMDTGYTEEECFNELQNECRGGCEHTIEKDFKILKNPSFALNIEAIIQNHNIEHVIVPVRNLSETALSREKNQNNHGGYGAYWMGAKNKEDQEVKHALLFYELIQTLEKHNVKFTTIHFPRMVEDPAYLDSRLSEVFDGYTYTHFCKCFERVADRDKISVE